MENTQGINYSVTIKNNPDKETTNLINTYWRYENGAFLNKPKQLSIENDIRLHDLFLTIKEYSYVEIECNCRSCTNILKQEVSSQTQFASTLKDLPLCKDCFDKRKLQKEEENKRLLEIRRKEQEAAELRFQRETAFKAAIESYNETRINEDNAKFMIHFINTCPNRISLSYYNENYSNFQKFKLLGLIHVEENLAHQYVIISYPDELQEFLHGQIKQESPEAKHKGAITKSRLSFLLENNKTYRNILTPRYSGTLMVREDVFFKKGTKCLYGVWERENNDAWLTLTPVSDIIISDNTPIHKEPEHVRDLLNRFLENPDYRDF